MDRGCSDNLQQQRCCCRLFQKWGVAVQKTRSPPAAFGTVNVKLQHITARQKPAWWHSGPSFWDHIKIDTKIKESFLATVPKPQCLVVIVSQIKQPHQSRWVVLTLRCYCIWAIDHSEGRFMQHNRGEFWVHPYSGSMFYGTNPTQERATITITEL